MKGGSEVLRKMEEALEELRRIRLLGRFQGVTVHTSPSDSNDTNDMLRHLSRHFPAWGPERRWRIPILEFCSAQRDERIARLCWGRGSLLVFIGGGCTGALQPLDTHLQGILSNDFQNMEMDMLTTNCMLEDKRVPVPDRTCLPGAVVADCQERLLTRSHPYDRHYHLPLAGKP